MDALLVPRLLIIWINTFTIFIGLTWWLRWWRICLQCGTPGFDLWVGKIPWRRKWQPTPVLLLGKSHGQRSLLGYSPWDHKELDMTEWLTLSLHCLLINAQSALVVRITFPNCSHDLFAIYCRGWSTNLGAYISGSDLSFVIYWVWGIRGLL